MRIIYNEMKKLWSWKILGIVAVVCALFFIMFMSYDVTYYKKGNHPHAENVYYAEELVRLYGTSITAGELADYISAERNRLINEAETYIPTMPVFTQAGVYSFEAYEALRESDRELTQAESTAYWALSGEECGYLVFYLQALASMENNYGFKPSTISNPDSFWQDLNDKEQTRYKEMLQNGEIHSVFSLWTYMNTKSYSVSFAIMLMLSVMIFTSPLLVSDRHENAHHLQYSSKLGRRIINRQLIATLLSAFILTTLLILIFGGIYSVNGTHVFWNNNINSEFNIGHYSVFSLTYGQWVAAMIALMYVLAFGISMLAFILSRFSRNLITLVMKLIPMFAAAAYLCGVVFGDLFSMLYNKLYNLFRIFGTEAYVCGGIALLAFAAVFYVVRREKRVDVM